MGKKPAEFRETDCSHAGNAWGVVLLVGGMIEMAGGRVTFAKPGESADLHINLGADQFSTIVATCQTQGNKFFCIVPEPVGNNRILVVVPKGDHEANFTCCVDILDVTTAPRQTLGGYAVISGTYRKDGKLKIDGMKEFLTPARQVEDLSEA